RPEDFAQDAGRGLGTGDRPGTRATHGAASRDSTNRPTTVSTIAPPAATFHCSLIARPATPARIASPIARAVIGAVRSHQIRAVAAGPTISATARMVPTAGSEVTTAASTS